MALAGTSGRHRIYLLRHGAVSYFDQDGKPRNPKTVSLTAQGRAQAAAAGAALAEVPFDRAVCSGLPRTRQTAEILLAGRDLAIDDITDLGEIRGGRFDTIPPARREAELVYGFEAAMRPGARFAGGEAFADFEARVVAAFEAQLATPGWTQLLMVAHDAVNRVLLGWACGAGLAAAASFEQDMGCLNIIDIDIAEGAVIRRLIKAVNLTPYNLAKLSLNLTSMEQVMARYMAGSRSDEARR
ncbi:MAG: histidine phosphatase family protein [Alphaproteobacteria bacterium]|jgi:probable phosphoglycerate mutase|nr:histidine phosphatase family protein [Alphaproteobacteria bacterium]MDP6517655.1 histidine phosphatase family protein [Alphaproteobacteria bacterium]